MNNDSPLKAIMVVTVTALVCSVLVTVAAVTLRPIQRAYEDLERIRFIVRVSGLSESVETMSDLEVIGAFQDLEIRLVDLDRGAFDSSNNPDTFDAREAATEPQFRVAIPAELDVASLGTRSSLETVYLLRDGETLQRVILPIHGQGMWSTIYGFLALESDLNTIAALTISEQGETPGIGDVILNPEWQARWQGRRLYDEQRSLRFRISREVVAANTEDASYHVDGLAGATVTLNGVMNLMRYWFGPHGYSRFLQNLSETEGS
ncbi:MAG: Na(+)-translocating NADH-quinone reductase subunit C [Gammaproteobacteria bacterium]|nr:Na(+)-translocating NADH-quinone reductase subunit C [Gammaproteobacteria bacterium]